MKVFLQSEIYIKTAGKQLDSHTLYEQQKTTIEKKRYKKGPAIIATDISSPDNIGGLLRTADAAGCIKVILINEKQISLSKKIHKIARSTEKNIEIIQCNVDEFLKLKEELYPLIAIEITDSSKDIFSTELPEKCSFVIGNERHGVPGDILALCKYAVHIPMYGVNGSMNVIQALTISLYEWRRQEARKNDRVE
jgi:23S rRNA (guanosine2251-2'-O)-methyltransferase